MTNTVYDAFSDTARRWADRPFVHIPRVAANAYSDSDIDWTYAQAATRISRLRDEYLACGVQPGQRAALLLGTRGEFFLHYLALNSLGVSIVPLSSEATSGELAYVLNDSASAFVLTVAERASIVATATAQLKTKLPMQVVLSDLSLRGLRVNPVYAAEPEEAALVYTSGSTAKPKGCVLSNAYMLMAGSWYRSIGGLCAMIDGQERLLTPLPLSHMNALAVSTTAMILSGGCIVQLDRFHASTWWDTVRTSRATIVHYLGVMPAILLKAPPDPADRKHCVKFGFGAGVSPKDHHVFEERFGVPLIESWSMTEVGGGAAIVAAHEPRHVGQRCFGRPSSHIEYRIVDDNEADVEEGVSGELLVRARGAEPRTGFFSGYANQWEATEVVWRNGYFHTGDIVRRGVDGSLHFVDRKKSIIRRSGENISSLEVEAVFAQLAQVAHVGAGPVDDDIRGEEVFVCIQLKPGEAAILETAEHLFAAAKERLSYFKLPGYIAFVSGLPLTTSQKLQRGELRTLSQDIVKRGAAFDLRKLKKQSHKG